MSQTRTTAEREGKRQREDDVEEDELVHGTTRECWESIKKIGGLHRMGRRHIHFTTVNPDSKSGKIPVRGEGGAWEKDKRDVIIFIDRKRAEKDGLRFYEHYSGGETVLTPGLHDTGNLPLAYFRRVVDVDTGDVLCEPVGACLLAAPPVKRGYMDGLPWTKHFFKVDFHAHVLPRNLDLCKDFKERGYIWLKFYEDGSGADMMKDDRLFRAIRPNCYDPEAVLEDMKANDIDVQVLTTVPVMFCYWTKTKEDAVKLARYINDDLAAVVKKYPLKFIALGTLPLQFPDEAVKEMRRCVKELGFKGFQIGSHVENWELSDPALFPVFEEAEKLGVGLMIHPWDMMGAHDHGPKYWLPWLVGMPAETTRAICHVLMSGMLQKLPSLRLMFAHGGGSFAYTAGRIQHGYMCRPDLCAVDCDTGPALYLANDKEPAKFWVDSLTHDEEALRFLVKKMGEDRVVMGSDYPFPLGEWVPGRMVENMDGEGWNDDRKRKLLSLNGLKFLDIDPRPYMAAAKQPGTVA